ncbi:hypothetical protein BRAS3843_120065 [Bradyrhizobium sp. STM 3843]|nr:hypothetical protein BRAS3843_120065 [Bradyrhizobium sp. STM 3843]
MESSPSLGPRAPERRGCATACDAPRTPADNLTARALEPLSNMLLRWTSQALAAGAPTAVENLPDCDGAGLRRRPARCLSS